MGVLKVKRGYELQLFAKYLIEGKIFQSFKKTSGNLLHNANDFLNKMQLSKHSMIILELLYNKGNMLISKKLLEKHWKYNPNFLRKEFREWVKQEFKKDIIWPPV
jgi:hypothetical protein